jgi:polyphosphate kinase 2 (PPK2 family)
LPRSRRRKKSSQQALDRGTLCFTASRLATEYGVSAKMVSAVKVKSGFALAELDLDHRLKEETRYQQKLRKLQIAMLELEEIYRVERRRGIIALEGWTASGKSGAIQRLIEKLDPRWVQV